ncbi:UDP-N-acetylmuramoyl-L-alanine--D-glutamate ligase [Candidatus Babeliales bacterium]|nr:UDP-N-acetylmuramoyl-L-alanine--D-glutamate ligase [Candidatus Babeliales bacterium]
MILKEKIGILGFGIVGKSFLTFLKSFNKQISIWDSRELTTEELNLINDSHAIISHLSLEKFIQENDSIFISPGFDTRDFKAQEHKFFCELDLFSQYFKGKSIAITGTLGKTTVTRLLGRLFESEDTLVGGNIGHAMLNLVDKNLKRVFLELSSFQLERNKNFAPNIAVITNFFPNHLDRHKNLKSYLEAKFKIFQKQNKNQFAVIPADLILRLGEIERVKLIKSQVFFVAARELNEKELFILKQVSNNIFYLRENKFVLKKSDGTKELCYINDFPKISFLENWLFIVSISYLLGLGEIEIKRRILGFKKDEIKTDPHRTEFFATFNGVNFYNDSKATIMEATIAALNRLEKNQRPIILILGGVSKGVDRRILVRQLLQQNSLKKIFCFGRECEVFQGCEGFSTLEELVEIVMNVAKKDDQVLFSPGGASFDLFPNFVARGERFKELVINYGKRQKANKIFSSGASDNC